MNPSRVIVAFLIAPHMTPLVLLWADRLGGERFSLGAFSIFAFVAGFAYAATAIFGVLAFFLFRAKRWSNIFLYVAAGGPDWVPCLCNPQLSSLFR